MSHSINSVRVFFCHLQKQVALVWYLIICWRAVYWTDLITLEMIPTAFTDVMGNGVGFIIG